MKKRRKYSEEEKARILMEYEGSGLTRKAYSEKKGIRSDYLGRWGKKQKKEPGRVRFIEIESQKKPERNGNRYRIEHQGGGLSLEFLGGFDGEEIRILAGIIKELGKC